MTEPTQSTWSQSVPSRPSQGAIERRSTLSVPGSQNQSRPSARPQSIHDANSPNYQPGTSATVCVHGIPVFFDSRSSKAISYCSSCLGSAQASWNQAPTSSRRQTYTQHPRIVSANPPSSFDQRYTYGQHEFTTSSEPWSPALTQYGQEERPSARLPVQVQYPFFGNSTNQPINSEGLPRQYQFSALPVPEVSIGQPEISRLPDKSSSIASSASSMGTQSSQRYSAINSPREPLDPRYRVPNHASRFFKQGKVFKMLWAQPGGSDTINSSSYSSDLSISRDARFGERIFSKIRYFVVIREGQSYSSALPILTYSGQGVAKLGVVKSEHAIIYTSKRPPDPRESELPSIGEPGLLSTPIRVDPDLKENQLDPMSRIDFGRVHTVQHNVKVKSFGMINRRSMEALLLQFTYVWRIRLDREIKAPSAGTDSSLMQHPKPSTSPVHHYLSTNPEPKALQLATVPSDEEDDPSDDNRNSEGEEDDEE